MKRLISNLILLVLFLGCTAGAAAKSVDMVKTFAQEKNQEKTALVEQRLEETIAMLSELCQSEYIRNQSVSYRDKATFLTNENESGNLGYMMIRILDEEGNIYREDQDYSTSNLASRDYIQRLYATGETQITDAFLAGADGKTINYTVASGILEEDKVTGAIFAAIYGTEFDDMLQDESSENVLIGSQFQYMGGIPRDQFGLTVAQVLESRYETSRPVENILLDFMENKGGSFWGMGSDGVKYYTYSAMENCMWVVMTEVSLFAMTKKVQIGYGCCIIILLIALVLVNRRKKTKVETT